MASAGSSAAAATETDSAPPPEVLALQEKIAAQGETVRELKTKQKNGEASEEEVNAAVQELLTLKLQLPPEYAPKSQSSKKKKGGESGGVNTQNERERKKAEARAAREKAARDKAAAKAAEDSLTAAGVLTDTYGDLPLRQSRDEDRRGRQWTPVGALEPSLAGQTVLIRGHVHNVRAQARFSFVVVRQGVATVQGVVNDANMSRWCASLPAESVVDVEGELVEPKDPTNTTQSAVELQVSTLFVVHRAVVQLPFSVSQADLTPEESALVAEAKAKEAAKLQQQGQQQEETQESKGGRVGEVGQELKLEHRHLSLRSPLQQAVMRVSSAVCQSFREFLTGRGFVEVQTPKLLGGSSEGGSEVFHTEYFGRPACLAQSPQLHKQMLAACSGLEKVFEIGPVFRAENSNTARHLCEFHGLDVEMSFHEHYHETLDVFSDLFHHVFRALNERCAVEIATVRRYHPEASDVIFQAPERGPGGEPLRSAGTGGNRTLLLTFAEGIALLRADGVSAEEQGDLEDLSTPVEKRLGALVKEKYGVDFFFLDKYPLAVRPFYTMPDAADARYSNSYDFMLRCQEIMSGAQRVHDADMLAEAVARKGVPVESLRFYIDAFRHGAMPHAGGGIGLERLVMLFLGLPNIRAACFFVRDPQRLTP